MDGQLVDVERWRGWTAGGCVEMAWMDSWWTCRDGVDGQLVYVERLRGWTAGGCGEMPWMHSWWMWNGRHRSINLCFAHHHTHVTPGTQHEVLAVLVELKQCKVTHLMS